jgi:hypothetical protein
MSSLFKFHRRTNGAAAAPGLISNGGDPYFDQVSMLVLPEGISSGATNTLPNWGYASPSNAFVPGTNQAAIDATVAGPYGASSASFVCTNTSTFTNMRTAADAGYNLTGSDFTIEGYFYYTTAGAAQEQYLFSIRDVNGGERLSLRRTINQHAYNVYVNGVATTAPTSGITSTGSWNYFAVTLSGTTLRVFLASASGGTQLALTVTGVTLGTMTDANSYMVIGAGTEATGSLSSYVGRLGEIRLTKGTARYTANFTPSTTEFPKWKDGYPKFTTKITCSPIAITSASGTTVATPPTWDGTPTITRKWQTTGGITALPWTDVAGATTTTSPLPAVRTTSIRYIETATVNGLTTICYGPRVPETWTAGL